MIWSGVSGFLVTLEMVSVQRGGWMSEVSE